MMSEPATNHAAGLAKGAFRHQLMPCTLSLVTQSVQKETMYITISLQYNPNKSLNSYCQMIMYDGPINHNHKPLLL